MSNSVQSERSSDRPAETEPTLAELMDPAALERRLTEARQRRAEAIRAREERAATGEDVPEGRAPARMPPRPVALPEAADFPAPEADTLAASPPRARFDEAPSSQPRPPLGTPPTIPRSPAAAPGPAPAPRDRGEAFPAAEAGAAARPAWTRPVSVPPRSILAEQSGAAARVQAPDARPAAPRQAPEPAAPPQRSGWTPPPAPMDPPPIAPGRPAEPTSAPTLPPEIGPAIGIGAPAPAKGRAGIGGGAAVFLSIFLIGLIGGGAAVLFAPPSIRARIAEAINPPAETPIARQEAPAPETPRETPPIDAQVAANPPEAQVAPPEAAAVEPTDGIAPPAPGDTTTAPRDPVAEPAVPAAADPAALIPPRPAPESMAEEATAVAPPAAPVEAEPAAPEPTELAVPESAAPESETADSETVASTALADARISLHYPATASATANELAADLRAAGAGAADVVPVGFSVSATNVRYYHAADRAAAEAVAATIGGAVETRDFTGFRPLPLPGKIEVWLSGQSGAAPARATPAPAAPAATASARVARPAPGAAPSRDLEAEEVERLLLSREVERMLRQGTEPSQ